MENFYARNHVGFKRRMPWVSVVERIAGGDHGQHMRGRVLDDQARLGAGAKGESPQSRHMRTPLVGATIEIGAGVGSRVKVSTRARDGVRTCASPETARIRVAIIGNTVWKRVIPPL